MACQYKYYLQIMCDYDNDVHMFIPQYRWQAGNKMREVFVFMHNMFIYTLYVLSFYAKDTKICVRLKL